MIHADDSHQPEEHLLSLSRSRFLERSLCLRNAPAGVSLRYAACTEASPTASTTVAVPQDLRSRVGDTARLLEDTLAGEARQTLSAKHLDQLGADLAEVALPEKVRTLLSEDLQQATRMGQRVRLWIDDQGSSVSGWPWEYLLLPTDNTFLVLHPACSLVRCCPAPDTPRQASQPGKQQPATSATAVDVLLVWADPQVPPHGPLHAEVQVQTILGFFEDRPDFRCRVLCPRWCQDHPPAWLRGPRPLPLACRDQFVQELEEHPPHLIYFLCHGDFNPGTNQGFIVLDQATPGQYEEIPAEELASLLGGLPGPQVIFLEACRSGNRGPQGDGRSVADALARPGRIVLGMQVFWPAPASQPFWTILFQTLISSRPKPIDDALFAAREFLSSQQELFSWGIPILYRPAPPALPLPPRPPAPRRVVVGLVEQTVRELERHGGLAGLRDQFLGLREALMQQLEILEQNAGEESSGLQEILEASDPLYVLLAGEGEDPMVDTNPLWYTHLLAPPTQLCWQPGNRPGPWRVALETEEDLQVIETTSPSAPLTRTIPSGVPVGWEVRESSAADDHQPFVQGVFQVLSPAEANAAAFSLRELEALPEGLERMLALARELSRFRLFDAVVTFCRQLLPLHPDGIPGFLLHRSLASAYAAVRSSLSKHFAFGVPEVEWAAQRARTHATQAFQALGLGSGDNPQ
jgi:hypothetical protein